MQIYADCRPVHSTDAGRKCKKFAQTFLLLKRFKLIIDQLLYSIVMTTEMDLVTKNYVAPGKKAVVGRFWDNGN
jgi:hypothetical protein